MAKYTAKIQADFDDFSQYITDEIVKGSMSANLEDTYATEMNGVRCRVQVYERYSLLGGNRVSLNVTMLADGKEIHLCAITSGGSQAVYFKLNTMGEDSFLEKLQQAVARYQSR